jgi:hypothetical protein
MTTHHIETCRRAWHAHADCPICKRATFPCWLCPEGRVLYDEYAASITANPQCEHITGTDTKEAI